MYGSPLPTERVIKTKQILLNVIHKRWRTITDNQVLALTADNFDYQAAMYDMMGQQVVHELRASFAEERLKKVKLQVVAEVDIPRNWFQHLKYQYAPQWFLKKFPLKTKKLVTPVIKEMDLSFLYPQLEMPKMKPDLGIVLFNGIVTKDEEGNERYE